MGGLMSYLFSGRTTAEHINDPSLDIVDKKTTLTQRQKNIIRENWALVEKDIRGNGVDFFVVFFKTYPNYQKYFESFADVPIDQLKDNRKVHAHAFNVMHAISSVVENLNDIECLLELLTKTGKNHIRRNVTIQEFKNLSVVFVDFLASKLGSLFTPFARNAWIQAFEVINSVIESGLNSESGK